MGAYLPDPEWVTETVRRTRAEQGLPPTIEDPVVLQRAADLMRPWFEKRAKEQRGSAA